MKSQEQIKLIVDAALRAARIEFAEHPSMTTTHEAMAEWMRGYLRDNGVAAHVAYIVHVGQLPGRAVGVFKVHPYKPVKESEFDLVIS